MSDARETKRGGRFVSDIARRQEILRVAEKLLLQYGPAKTTMGVLAREAKIAVGSVYLEFASKEAIVEALSSARHCRLLEAMQTAAAKERPFAERLTAIFDTRTSVLLGYAEEGGHTCELVHCVNRAVKAAQQRFAEEQETLVAAILRDGARSGELVAPKPLITARAILRAYIVFSPPHLFELPRDDVRAALRATHELVLQGILARSPRVLSPTP